MADSALRQILMLRHVPREPRKITTRELKSYLENQEGTAVTERTIQRDLMALSAHFPLRCDTRVKPFGWSFRKDADVSIASMDANTAITLDMVQRFLSGMMPAQALDSLRPQMDAAQKHLKDLRSRGKQRWSEKVATLPRGLPLKPASVKPAVLDAVYLALLEERALEIVRNDPDKPQVIHPLGLVHRGPVIYLVCGFWDYPDVRQLALHRIQKAIVLEEARRVPAAFEGLDNYLASGEFSYRISDKPVRLKVRFYERAGEHLKETPLSDDQRITRDDGQGAITLEATVADTHELRWWLQGFGAEVEVLGPTHLRREFIDLARNLAARYR